MSKRTDILDLAQLVIAKRALKETGQMNQAEFGSLLKLLNSEIEDTRKKVLANKEQK